jgi:hypothetical protein
MHLQLGFIIVNQVEKMLGGVQWPMNHLPNRRNNYIFIYLWMPQKMDNINIFFIQFNISRKYKLHTKLQTVL